MIYENERTHSSLSKTARYEAMSERRKHREPKPEIPIVEPDEPLSEWVKE